MSFQELEARITAQLAEKYGPPAPKWHDYKHVRYDMDGLTHRVVASPSLAMILHDEIDKAGARYEPWTGCGIPLRALVIEAPRNPELVGFAHETEALTCMTCMSGRPELGDVQRQAQKNAMFGALYGKQVNTLAQVYAPRPNLFRKQLSRHLLELASKP